MALATQICLTSECIGYLGIGSSITDADRALITMIRQMVENQARRFVRHGITQPASAYTEFYPRHSQSVHDIDEVETIGDRVYFISESGDSGVLQLANMFVRSITTLHEDPAANFGYGASDFAAATLLTAGTDYYLEADEQDSSNGRMSRAGHVRRTSGYWSSRPGTIKVVYVAGFTAAELDGPYSDIKLAIIEEVAGRFKLAKSKKGASGAPGPIKSEMIGQQYSVTYDTSVENIVKRKLSNDCKEALESIMRLSLAT